jgi:hypothetical protein
LGRRRPDFQVYFCAEEQRPGQLWIERIFAPPVAQRIVGKLDAVDDAAINRVIAGAHRLIAKRVVDPKKAEFHLAEIFIGRRRVFHFFEFFALEFGERRGRRSRRRRRVRTGGGGRRVRSCHGDDADEHNKQEQFGNYGCHLVSFFSV